MLKSITGKELFRRFPDRRVKLSGGKFWTSGYSVGQYANEEVIKAYVKNQEVEKDYKKLPANQLTLF
ncbi:transposase [Echinicola marina]|nr:transposase [Echinicola marina]